MGLHSHTPQKIVVVGAGLVGPLLALFLKKRGHRVHLLEKRPDPRKGPREGGRSINLVITSRGIHALKKLGLWQRAQAITTPVMGRMVHHQTGGCSYSPYGRDDSECNFSVSRGELNELLISAAEDAGIVVDFEKSVEGVDPERREIFCGSSSSSSSLPYAYDILFGADGGGSAVRKSFEKRGALTSFSAPLGVGYKELMMPAPSPCQSSSKWPMEKKALHIWPRKKEMLMGLPNRDGSFTMTYYAPDKKVSFFNFKELYSDALSLMPDYKEDISRNPWGLLGTLRCRPWVYKDSLCLVGDAAHAIVPFFGQGMNCGFEDCTLLDELLSERKMKIGSWGELFQKYEALQRPNAEAIAEMALQNFVEMSDHVGDESFIRKKSIERALEKAFPHEYHSRYRLVTYTLMPYRWALEAGKIQDEILTELLAFSEGPPDLKKARALIEKKLTPFMEAHPFK